MRGRVFTSMGSWYEVKGDDAHFYQCRLRGKFKNDKMKLTNPLAVGDYVEFEVEEHEKSAVIHEIADRMNYLIRKSSRKKEHYHIIAANIDQVLIVATIHEPRTSTGFINRVLVSAESFRIPAIVIFNKEDLFRQQDREKAERLKAIYENVGCRCFFTSAKENTGLDALVKAIENKTTLIAGHSGVGKSSILNAIEPSLDLEIGGLTKSTSKGSHTTTFARMFELKKNTYIIDTPGVKEFGLEDMKKQELSDYFPEMRQFLGTCKFHNCLHINEPDCKVLEALEKNEIAESRYKTYLSLLDEVGKK